MAKPPNSDNCAADAAVALEEAKIPALVVERAPREGIIIFATESFCRASGYTSQELVGRNLMSLDIFLASLHREEQLRSGLHSNRPTFFPMSVRSAGSQGVQKALLLLPLAYRNGQSSQLLCIWLDHSQTILTDISPADVRRIVLSKAEWESTIDSLQELVLLVDADMRVIRANRTIEQWGLGNVHTAKGRGLHEILHPGCCSSDCPLVTHWDRISASDGAGATTEFSDDDAFLKRRVNITFHVVPSREGRAKAVTVVVRDVSRNHEREEIKRRQERFEAMGHLVGGLAHEIGNPLAAMRATVEVWSRNLDRFDHFDNARFLARLGAGIDRMQATVDRIRTWGSRRRHVEEVVSVWPILEEIHALFQAQATEAKVDLALSHAPDCDLQLLGDPSALYEVCVNVVKNAIEACSEGDRVVMEAGAEDGYITLRVADTGCGISSSDMRHLFAPFFTTKPTGTGIGLAQANNLMEQMGARIDVQSAEGVGTTVTLRFRRADDVPPRSAS